VGYNADFGRCLSNGTSIGPTCDDRLKNKVPRVPPFKVTQGHLVPFPRKSEILAARCDFFPMQPLFNMSIELELGLRIGSHRIALRK